MSVIYWWDDHKADKEEKIKSGNVDVIVTIGLFILIFKWKEGRQNMKIWRNMYIFNHSSLHLSQCCGEEEKKLSNMQSVMFSAIALYSVHWFW